MRREDLLLYLTSGSVRVPTAQGKQGKWKNKNPCQGKHREFGNFAKTQGILFAQVVNSLILKVKDIAIFAAKISICFPEAEWVYQHGFVYVIVTNYVNWHRENLQLDKENTGKTQGIEWVPCSVWTIYCTCGHFQADTFL